MRMLLVMVMMGAVSLGSVAQAQYPYESMFQPNNSWRGRIVYHRGPFGGTHYRRHWGGGLTANGVAGLGVLVSGFNHFVDADGGGGGGEGNSDATSNEAAREAAAADFDAN